ncbi:MAG TPA: right-handed parallel beta-helix repeat-containing protein, partial [Thermoplasmata archaeon]|nr:right-handed parallel beta-helix repeat-containing protein [Thermoplasmata archaeon]
FLATNFSGVGFRGAWVIYSTNITFQSVDLSRFGAYGLQANNSDGLSLLAINASDSNQSGATGFSLDSDLEVEIANSSSDATAWGVVATGDGGLTIENSSFVGELTSAFAVLIESSRSVTVRSDNLSHASGDALYVESSAGVTIADNDLTYAGAYALVLSGTAQVQADGNDLRFAASASAGIFSGLGVTVTNERGGDSTQPYGVGFVVASGADVLLENDSAPATNVSFELSGAADVQLLGSNGSDSYVGVQFSNVNGATVAGNTFDNDRFGFSTGGDFGVMVYHNNFVNDSGWMNPASAEQVTWDHGYPGGGNFWGNWTGPDLRSGPFQDLTGADGLVDTPLTINGSNVDRYPLTRPWTEHTIAFSETGLGPGTAWSIDVAGTVLRGTSPVLVYSVVNASNESLPYRVVPVPGYVTLSAPTGTVAFNGTDLLVPVRFSPYTYPVSFHESGLAEGTAWSVSFDSSSLLTDFPDANTTAPNGSYAYSVANVSGYALTTPGGTVTVDAAGVVVPILFVEIVHPTVYHNQTVYQNETIYDNGTGGSGGSNGSGNGGSGGGGGGTSAAKPATSPAGYSPMVVYALIAALAALAVLAALGFVLYGRARNRAPPTPAQPWSPPPAPTGTSAPPPGATGAAVAAIPAVGAAVRPAGAPDWREDP